MKQSQFFQKLKQFQDDKKGNIMILFAMLIIPILALMGGAIDFKRAFNAKEDLRVCMESAALAIPGMGLGANVDDSVINDAVQSVLSAQPRCSKYLDSNTHGIHATFTGKIIRDGGPRTGRINVTAQATIDTLFLGALYNSSLLNGQRWARNLSRIRLDSANNPLEIDVASNTKVEVALVLDTTGSMGGWLGGKQKMASLKESVTDLIDNLRAGDPECAPFPNQPNSNADVACKHVKVGMVPFSSRINIGTPEDSTGLFKDTDNYSTPTDTIPTWLNTSQFPENNSNGTITVDAGDQWIQPYVDSWLLRYTIPQITNYLDYLGIGYSQNTGSSEVNISDWLGCVLPRSGSLYTDNSLAYDGDNDSKITAEKSSYCPTKPVTRLTHKIEDIKTLVNTLTPSGSTNTAIGLEWGWRLLSQGVDQGIDFDETGSGNEEVVAYDDKEWQKVIILMTDGTNSSWTSNGLTETLCDNIKDADIKIFSIAFLPESAQGGTAHELMKNCASKGSYFYHATSSIGLATSFSTIAKEISALRVAR